MKKVYSIGLAFLLGLLSVFYVYHLQAQPCTNNGYVHKLVNCKGGVKCKGTGDTCCYESGCHGGTNT